MQGREVKAVLFDMDGVIVDSSYAWFMAFNDVLAESGSKTLSKNEFSKYFGNPVEKDKQLFFGNKSIKEIILLYNHYFRKWKNKVVLFKESVPTLEALNAKKVRTGLISNASREIVEINLSHFKLKKYFDVIVTLNDVKKRKPAPEMVLKACKILRISPKNTMLVGDTKNDMVAGKMAGCLTVGYKIKGDFQIRSLGSILKFFK